MSIPLFLSHCSLRVCISVRLHNFFLHIYLSTLCLHNFVYIVCMKSPTPWSSPLDLTSLSSPAKVFPFPKSPLDSLSYYLHILLWMSCCVYILVTMKHSGLQQKLIDVSPQDKSSLLSVSGNKVLLANNHTHALIFCLYGHLPT